MNWLEITVQVDREAVESVSEVLTRYGYGGVVIEEPGRPGPNGGYEVDLAAPITMPATVPSPPLSEQPPSTAAAMA